MRKVKIIQGLVFLLILNIIACYERDKNFKKKDLLPKEEITVYSDSSFFFGDISGMQSTDNIIVMNDTDFETAIIFDTSFNYITSIAGKGRGPDEIEDLGRKINPIIKNKNIYLYDLIKNDIIKFNLAGNMTKTIDYPFNAGHDYISYNFCMDNDGNFYASSYLSNKPIIKFNQQGVIIKEFGEFLQGTNKKHKRAINYRHLVKNNHNIICIYVSRPKIEVYSKKGELLLEKEFNNFFEFFIERTEKKIQKNPQMRFATHTLFRDVYIYNSKLYCLFWGDYQLNNHPYANQIAVFNLKNLNLDKILNLKTRKGNSSFSSFCVFNNKLIAFDALSGSILIYNLKNNF